MLFAWIVSNSYAQSDTHVTVTATLLEVYSNVHDGTDKRHRWRLWAAVSDEDYGSEHGCDIDSKDRGEWWPCNREILYEDDLNEVPSKIRIRFYGYEKENFGGKKKERIQDFSFPIDFPEGIDKEVILQLDAKDYADGLYQARIHLKYMIPKPNPSDNAFFTSSTLNGNPESNFCEGSTIYLNTQAYNPGTDLLPGEFKYIWEYHFLNDDITETTSTPARISTNSTCYDPKALVDISINGATTDPNRNYGLCGGYVYDITPTPNLTKTITQSMFGGITGTITFASTIFTALKQRVLFAGIVRWRPRSFTFTTNRLPGRKRIGTGSKRCIAMVHSRR